MVLVILGQYQVICKSYPKQEELKYAIIISTVNNGMVIHTLNINKGNEIKLLKFLNIYLFM